MRKVIILIVLGLVAAGIWAYSWSMTKRVEVASESFAPDKLPQSPERQRVVGELEAARPTTTPEDRARILREMGI